MRTGEVLCLCLLAVGCRSDSVAQKVEAPGSLSAPFHFQAHRGAGIARPENTLESFMFSWRLGATPEADLRTTKDGVIVCFHDKTLKRIPSNVTADQKKLGIKDLTFSEVRKLEVGSFKGKRFAGERVPAVSEVFEKMKGHPERVLYLDIKDVDLDRLFDLIHKYGVEKQVIFATSRYELIRSWKKRLPQSLTLLWMGGTEKQLSEKLKRVREAGFEGITHLQIHVKVGDLESDDPFTPSSAFLGKVAKELKARGIVFQVLPWNCSDPRAYVKLLELGAESFATDHPEVTLEAVREYRKAVRR